MKILYFDLNCSGDFFESYSCNPKRYGGGGAFARWAKEILNKNNNIFKIIAPRQCFNELQSWENKDACYPIDDLNFFKIIKLGYPIDKLINGLSEFDIICSHDVSNFINKGDLKIPVVSWNPFGNAEISHPYNDYCLCYNHKTKKKYDHQPIKYIKIGKPIPKEFNNIEKKDFIFQCTHHCKDFNTNEVAKNCLKYGIKGYFAGPIHDNYNLMDFIDNKITFYLGEISEEEKLKYTKEARMYTLCLNCDIPFNLSAIEANSLGTPILASRRGWLKEYIKDGVNGFFYDGNNFLKMYNETKNFNQKECWESAKQYSIEEMIESFYNAFLEIKNEFKT